MKGLADQVENSFSKLQEITTFTCTNLITTHRIFVNNLHVFTCI